MTQLLLYIGDTVGCYADLIKIGRTSIQFNVEVWTRAYDENSLKKVAADVFTFVAIDDFGKPQPVNRNLSNT